VTEIYLLNNRKELRNETYFVEDESPGWHPKMSLNNRSIVASDPQRGNMCLKGFYYKGSWIKKLIPV